MSRHKCRLVQEECEPRRLLSSLPINGTTALPHPGVSSNTGGIGGESDKQSGSRFTRGGTPSQPLAVAPREVESISDQLGKLRQEDQGRGDDPPEA